MGSNGSNIGETCQFRSVPAAAANSTDHIPHIEDNLLEAGRADGIRAANPVPFTPSQLLRDLRAYCRVAEACRWEAVDIPNSTASSPKSTNFAKQ